MNAALLSYSPLLHSCIMTTKGRARYSAMRAVKDESIGEWRWGGGDVFEVVPGPGVPGCRAPGVSVLNN